MSHYLSLSQLENIIKNVSAVVDVPLKNLNPDFVIDNYVDPNTLRSSMLRTEFNTLCKGKTESKNIGSVKYVNEKKIYLCKEDQIRDIPPLLKSIFIKPSKYYILGTPSNSSFFYALLSILNSDFILQGNVHKEAALDTLRDELVFNLDKFYTENNYKSKRFKKSVIRDNILNKKIFLPQVIHYILDYHNICLVIFDTETYLYTLGNDYSEDREYIMMLRKNNYFQPIMNSEGGAKFTYEVLSKVSQIMKPEVEIDTQVKSTTLPATINTETFTLEKETKYKLAELQTIAQKFNIGIKKANTNRNKKKTDLYQEITTYLSSKC